MSVLPNQTYFTVRRWAVTSGLPSSSPSSKSSFQGGVVETSPVCAMSLQLFLALILCSGVRLSPLVGLFEYILPGRMVERIVDEMIGNISQSSGQTPAPVPLRPPQIPHGVRAIEPGLGVQDDTG
jgi:hypothetical protein